MSLLFYVPCFIFFGYVLAICYQGLFLMVREQKEPFIKVLGTALVIACGVAWEWHCGAMIVKGVHQLMR